MDIEATDKYENIIKELVDSDVLVSNDGGLVLSNEFKCRVEERENQNSTLKDGIEYFDSIDNFESSTLPSNIASKPALEFVILNEMVNLDESDILRFFPVMDSFRHDQLRVDGNPEPFIPVRPKRIPLISALYEKVVLYIWRDECPPCKVMKESFENILEDSAYSILFLSCFGPDSPSFLHETYEVSGAPAVLFLRQGKVDTRMYRTQPESVVKSELDILESY